MRSGKRNMCRITDVPAEDHRKQNHCEVEKRRRDKMNHYINKLASMVPSCSNMPCRLDKLTVLRMAVQHIKSIKSSLCGFSSFHLRPSFLSSGNLLKNLISQMAAQEGQDSMFLVVSCNRGKVLFVSESVKDVLFYDQQELIGQNLFDILHKDDVAKVKEQISLSVSPKEMLVDSKTLQPLKGSRQAIHQSHNSATSSTPPGARRSFFCRIKTGHLRSPNIISMNEVKLQQQHHERSPLLNHQEEEEAPTNHKQHCQSDRHQSTHSQRVLQSNPTNQNGQHHKGLEENLQQHQHHNLNLNEDALMNQNFTSAPTPINLINKNIKSSSQRGHAKYIVMRCTGYLRAINLRNDFINMNDMDDSTSGNDDSLDEDNDATCKSINCLVAVCRRVPVDKDFKLDRPITFTCRYSVDGKFVFADQRTTVALGYLPQELLGTSHYEYCNPEHYKIVSDCHKQSLQKAEPVSSDVYQFRRKNGSYLWLQTRLKSFRNPWTNYIEFLIANHTTADEVEPAHYSEGCVPTKFNQDITAPQSQFRSLSSLCSLSTPSTDSSKKSSSLSSSSKDSTYSVDSWTQNDVFRMLNNSCSKVERAKVGQSIAKRVIDSSYRKQADINGVARSDSLGSGWGSAAGNGTEAGSIYSDPPSCSSNSSQSSVASSELQMLFNYVESVNNVSGNVTNINANSANSITANQIANTNIHLCDSESGTSSAYNTSSSLSGRTCSISEASGSSSSTTGKSSANRMAKLTGKNKSSAGNSRHYHHHHHCHYHHHAQSCRSKSSGSSDTGIESSSWASSDSSLFITSRISNNSKNQLVASESRETRPKNFGDSSASKSTLKLKSAEARLVEAMNRELKDLSSDGPNSITGSEKIVQTLPQNMHGGLDKISTVDNNMFINAIRANTNLSDTSLMVDNASNNANEKLDLIIQSSEIRSGSAEIVLLNSNNNHHVSQQSFIMQQSGLTSGVNVNEDLQIPIISSSMEVPVDMDEVLDDLSEYLNPQVEGAHGSITMNSMPHIMQRQVSSERKSLDQEITKVPYDCFGMVDLLQPGLSNPNQPRAHNITHQQEIMAPVMPESSVYNIHSENNFDQPSSHCLSNAHLNSPIIPLESNTDLNNIGASSLFEEIGDDVLLEYVANLDSDTEFSNLPIWHLSCGRF